MTKLGVIVPAANNGARVFENARPVFGDQGSVVYHGDRQSQFMNGEKTYVQTAEGAFIALGLEDIRNTAGQVLAGWALTEGGQAAYQPGQAVDSARCFLGCKPGAAFVPGVAAGRGHGQGDLCRQLPRRCVGPGGRKAGRGQLSGVFARRSPAGAAPGGANRLSPAANKVEVDGRVVNRYSVAGWSIHPQGEQAGDRDGVYSPGTQYAHGIQQEITFYLRWLDQGASAENTWVYFFIRDDRSLPQEPGSLQRLGLLSPNEPRGAAFSKTD